MNEGADEEMKLFKIKVCEDKDFIALPIKASYKYPAATCNQS